MAEEQNQTSSYRGIFKATSLFGGVQAYQILIGVIKSKFVAILLGPEGMGIQGLYQSAIQLIQSFSSLGLSRSAVRDVSEANGSGNTNRIGLTVAVVKKLVWLTGLLGLVLTIIFSPVLSKTTFGNYDYTIPFIILSIILLLEQLSAGQRVVLQGMRKHKFLAKSTAIGSTFGLIVSVPLYYLFGVEGIVPTLILNSLTMLALTWYFSKKVDIKKIEVTNREAFIQGQSMMKMGLAMSVSGIVNILFVYLLRGFIRYSGGLEQVGLFTAGFAIMNTYVGMIFNAMITDYYPRMAAVNDDNQKCRQMINQQSEIGLLIMAPMLLICLIFMPIVIEILYSDKFLETYDYIIWAIPGMLFKLCSWAIAIIFVAKGARKTYMANELIGNSINFLCSIAGFYFYGLAGMGIGFTIGYFFYFLKVYIAATTKYEFSFTKSLKTLWSIQFLLVVSGLIGVMIFTKNTVYVLGIALILCSAVISIKELNTRLNIFKKLNHGK